ncbi:16S rRNA (adenine(1518)-N(6)/adenine(1519)-N(6))-dimethyltransferase RsmA [Buchnera aphidicola]|uniref:Ribosomal RNA small subunit methyltransferase A n=1 Tax=Buchnera aphidicola (Cinara strobi) TaxID=1921549 RepID=A0A3B1DVR0_9GAMM|nr:16S rRNA (adenine(1518)-N(6)/adenine(1519)-N(6))-dimethyltransferase RsmA [Buchnera aphidicola]VAX76353.1 Ribosomal RNA small subunit methyltransferase A [Buchnera aphidicola (Cinara strobi)]
MNKFIFNQHTPIKKLGQNFLKNKIIISKIINLIDLNYTDHVIEIGPGFGALTFPMCDIVDKITILEIDEKIVFFLSQCLLHDKLNIILTDAMRFDFKYFFSLKKNVIYRFVGNLPYNISTSFFLLVTKYYYNIYDMHFMFQKEVAERLLASPDTKSYGRLSIIAQCFYRIVPLLSVNKLNFFPIPKVDSIFLRFRPNNFIDSKDLLSHYTSLGIVTRISFSHRRKLLYKNLSGLFSKKELLSLNIDPYARAENIPVSQYIQLAKIFLKNKL